MTASLAGRPASTRRHMEHGWTTGANPSEASLRAMEREVFERVFGYRAARGVKVPRFTDDHEMTEAVISHVEEAWQPKEFRIWRRRNAAQEWAVEALIRTGPASSYAGTGPTRGVAVCRAALFLAANRARKSERAGGSLVAASQQGEGPRFGNALPGVDAARTPARGGYHAPLSYPGGLYVRSRCDFGEAPTGSPGRRTARRRTALTSR